MVIILYSNIIILYRSLLDLRCLQIQLFSSLVLEELKQIIFILILLQLVCLVLLTLVDNLPRTDSGKKLAAQMVGILSLHSAGHGWSELPITLANVSL